MEMMLEVAMGVMDMEDDKVADMVLRIPNEDFTDETLAIGDIYGDDVRGGDGGDGTPYDIRVSLKRQNDFW